MVIWPRGQTPPLYRVANVDVQVQRFGIPWHTSHVIPITVHEREVPEWVNSNEKLRRYVEHRFPYAFDLGTMQGNAKRRRRARKRAAELCAVLYLAFRMLMSYESIGALLKIEPYRAKQIAQLSRRHAEKFFADKWCCGNLAHTRRLLAAD
jgi:hypothetical protein